LRAAKKVAYFSKEIGDAFNAESLTVSTSRGPLLG
jgi:hypothetical protein